jgi:Arc/MetJ-type ribon-helix-helix transcriptional regulator
MTSRLTFLFAFLCFAACSSEESKIAAKAEKLCEADQLDRLNLEMFEDGVYQDLVRAEDIAFAKDAEKALEGNAFAELAAIAVPYQKLKNEHAECEVQVAIANGEATASVRRTAPKPALKDELELIGSLAASPIEEVHAKAKRLLQDAPRETESYEIRFERTEGKWLANLGLPESQETKERFTEYMKKVRDLIRAGDYRSADEVLKKAELLDTDNESVQSLRTELDKELNQLVAGNWRLDENKDEMDDTLRTVVSLPAVIEGEPGVFTPKPILIARCDDGRLDLFLAMDEYLGLRGVKTRVRFGKAPAEFVGVGLSENGKSVFFDEPWVLVNQIIKKEGEPLRFEVQSRLGDRQSSFDTDGAKLALAKVITPCTDK